MRGIGVSPGIAIGKAIIKKHAKMNIKKKEVEKIEEEITRLNHAKKIGREKIERLYNHTLESIGKEEAAIFDAHLMILDDPEVFGQIEEMIRNDKVNAEWAIKAVTDMFIEIFNKIEDTYVKERIADLKDITDRVLRILLQLDYTDFSYLEEEGIIVAEDLTPSDTAQMDRKRVLGFITEVGGKTSHSAIMARTLEIPAVVGVEGVIEKVRDGDILLFDGDEGLVLINPHEDLLEEYKKKKREYEYLRNRLSALKGVKSETIDGFKVELVANIGTPEDVNGVIRNDGEGVGLYRTEFLYMDRNMLPTEDEQFKAYKLVVEKLKNKPVVIRTLDIGGDKALPYIDLPNEMNPFLGYRAIRMCLDKIDMFKIQLRALLRASAYGDIKIMFPMISSMDELRRGKEILETAKEELRKEQKDFNKDVEVGIMIEIPSAAIISDMLAKEVDFFSIGTNDLIQYTMAVDRGNQKIAHLYNQFHPALLRVIKIVIDNGHKAGIWVGMCGEAAGDPKLIPLLIGMGLDEFSMSPSLILKARWVINHISQNEMKHMVDDVLNLATAEEVEKFIEINMKIDKSNTWIDKINN